MASILRRIISRVFLTIRFILLINVIGLIMYLLYYYKEIEGWDPKAGELRYRN